MADWSSGAACTCMRKMDAEMYTLYTIGRTQCPSPKVRQNKSNMAMIDVADVTHSTRYECRDRGSGLSQSELIVSMGRYSRILNVWKRQLDTCQLILRQALTNDKGRGQESYFVMSIWAGGAIVGNAKGSTRRYGGNWSHHC